MKTICIEMLDDGSFSVYEGAPEAEEGMEAAQMEGMPAMPEVESDSTQGQPAATVDEALELARGMLGGEQAAPGKSPEELFQGGFTKARGMPAGM